MRHSLWLCVTIGFPSPHPFVFFHSLDPSTPPPSLENYPWPHPKIPRLGRVSRGFAAQVLDLLALLEARPLRGRRSPEASQGNFVRFRGPWKARVPSPKPRAAGVERDIHIYIYIDIHMHIYIYICIYIYTRDIAPTWWLLCRYIVFPRG